jgi:hypothetical protein
MCSTRAENIFLCRTEHHLPYRLAGYDEPPVPQNPNLTDILIKVHKCKAGEQFSAPSPRPISGQRLHCALQLGSGGMKLRAIGFDSGMLSSDVSITISDLGVNL